jgi:energy-coupling factor transporter ATP-binding protein EcfA2
MHIHSIHIENFRAIRLIELKDLPNAIVVAGPNGCGKSSIFDAIRLLKSAYGQYIPNEYQSFFQEFQINIQRLSEEAHRVFHDPSKSLHIKVEFELADIEKTYLLENAHSLFASILWGKMQGGYSPTLIPQQLVIDPTTRRIIEPDLDTKVNQLFEYLKPELEKQTHTAELKMLPGGEPYAESSPVVELIFSLYQPKYLGVVEYYGPNRNYVREQVGGINLQIVDSAQQQSQHALYNTENKYRNVKTEMAQSYIRQILAREAGVQVPAGSDLIETLHELFEVFFPGKKFLGPIPTESGGLSFPVRLENGREHDIDELSSGEKEVLLGYLRLRNNAPKNSIILLDEPELHLNPRLIRGLPRFYQKHLGKTLGNQLWLITHSDALLREAVEEPAYAVYHMQPAYTTAPESNQAIPVSASAQVERALIDLVGDLATYIPRSKVVVLLEGQEGRTSDKFDVRLVNALFPLFAERVNLISGGNKYGVKTLQVLLDEAAADGKLDAQFYSVADKDYDGPTLVDNNRQQLWDVYHIENYLLEPQFILEVLNGLKLGIVTLTEEEVENQLRKCAEETVDSLIKIQLNQWVHSHLVRCIDTGFHPQLGLIDGFHEAAKRSVNKMSQVLSETLTKDAITSKKEQIQTVLTNALQNNQWKVLFRGRDILNRFVGRHVTETNYEAFRNLIVNQMRERGHQPPGMKRVIETILAS